MKLKHVLIILASLYLGACAGTKLTKDSFNNLQTISISEQVILPDKATFYGQGRGFGMAVGGAVGAVIEDVATEKQPNIISYMKTNNIDVGQIVLTEFKKQIMQKPAIAPRITNDNKVTPDATFYLEINNYGLGAEHGFSSRYRPLIRMSAKLVKKSGEIVWQKNEYAHHMVESIVPIPLDQYFVDSEIMAIKFEEVAKMGITNLLENLEP